MIRIIKHGKYKNVKCAACECEFEFDNTDLQDNKIKCPECFEEVTVPSQPERPQTKDPKPF